MLSHHRKERDALVYTCQLFSGVRDVEASIIAIFFKIAPFFFATNSDAISLRSAGMRMRMPRGFWLLGFETADVLVRCGRQEPRVEPRRTRARDKELRAP